MKTGWIGLGAMGAPMAGHLQAAGLLVGAWNRGEARRAAFAEQQPAARLAESPEALAGDVEVLALCVSADPDLAAVLDRVEARLRPGTIVVDHSTVSPAAARAAAERLAARDVAFVDAPVTGGVEGARNGQLAIMAGGDELAFERLAPVFAAYGKVWRHLGPAGSGQSAKAVNQLIVAGIAEAVCEALALVEKLDLPREAMLELLGGGAAGNWFLDKRGRSMLDDSFDVGFEPALLLKDLKICKALADEAGFGSTVLPGALADYQRLVDGGETGKDISALIRIKR
ncbi:NAD(P)-dependent oxidoreductase [Wenzhouxiangella sp. XN79A]|uniref:NAD(P)-binding domain-containing protein n=1 Tax=Wenzhouxiangella sp. XN79A TaxID=2724193 RepID=UPI00144AA7E4|nr:NAD(P)-dependent oxidoreductase [Wenzhouxiangella sp. XN79A]